MTTRKAKAPAPKRKAKKPPKNKGGRPTVMTAATVKKLEEAFLLGCSDLEACFAAGISKPTLYKYQELHPEFADRKEALKKRPVFLARGVVLDALEKKDLGTAHRVIERHDGTKVNVDLTTETMGQRLRRLEQMEQGGGDVGG